MKKAARGGLFRGWKSLLLFAARHLAFHALDVEVEPAQELVVRHGVLGQDFLAGVVGMIGPFQMEKLPSFRPALISSMRFLVSSGTSAAMETMSMAPSLTPHQVWPVAHLPSSASRVALT